MNDDTAISIACFDTSKYNLPECYADDDDNNDSDNDSGGSNDDSSSDDDTEEEYYDTSKNSGTLIIDATCAPQNIKYPQDINLLNEAREKLEKMIKKICKDQNWYAPRMYRKRARKDYLSIAKCRKRSAK